MAAKRPVRKAKPKVAARPAVRIAPHPKPPSKKQLAKDRKNQFLWAEGQQESGGNYKAVNSESGALGRWQVMPANLPGWAADAGLKAESAQYFLDHPSYQDKMVYHILGGYYDDYGPRGAASMWYSGQSNWHATYGHPPVYEYVDDVIKLMGGAPISGTGSGGLGQTGGGGTTGIFTGKVPAPGKEDWSTQVSGAASHLRNAAVALDSHSTALRHLRIRR